MQQIREQVGQCQSSSHLNCIRLWVNAKQIKTNKNKSKTNQKQIKTNLKGGTYFPLKAMYGRQGFPEVCQTVSEAWMEEKQKIRKGSKERVEKIKNLFITTRQNNQYEMSVGEIDVKEICKRYVRFLLETFDIEEGGFGPAPKFPKATVYEAIFAIFIYSRENEVEGINELLENAFFSLKKMAYGGINDQLSPHEISSSHGFHRYSVDRFFHVPHYEKMIYDQAQLLDVYSTAHKLALKYGFHDYSLLFKDVCYGILKYVSSEMTHEDGSIFTAEDADSLPTFNSTKSKEGAFYVIFFY